jgi:hypothetical protein
MPSDPIFGRSSRTNRGSVASLANDALYSKRINEQRRPARMRPCPHGHGHRFNCCLCVRQYEAELGLVAPRL